MTHLTTGSYFIYVFVMALTTYLIRMLPLTLFRKPIKSRFVRSFLAYVPCACLSAMTFPAILYGPDFMLSGAAALLLAIFLAFRGKSLVTVAASSCVAVFVVDQLLHLLV